MDITVAVGILKYYAGLADKMQGRTMEVRLFVLVMSLG